MIAVAVSVCEREGGAPAHGYMDHDITGVDRCERSLHRGLLDSSPFASRWPRRRSGNFYQYNGDYAGFAQTAIETAHPGATAMFMMGCGGDINPAPRGTVELAEQHGKSLAAAVDLVLADELHPVEGPLAIWSRSSWNANAKGLTSSI